MPESRNEWKFIADGKLIEVNLKLLKKNHEFKYVSPSSRAHLSVTYLTFMNQFLSENTYISFT